MKDVIVTARKRTEHMDLEVTEVSDNQMSRLENQLINGCEGKISLIQTAKSKILKNYQKKHTQCSENYNH